MSGSRTSGLERWNIGYDRLKSVNEGFILVRVSSYGQTGSYKDRAGFGSVGEKLSGDSAISRVILIGLPPGWESVSVIRWPGLSEPSAP
jgi:hypothetical protein